MQSTFTLNLGSQKRWLLIGALINSSIVIYSFLPAPWGSVSLTVAHRLLFTSFALWNGFRWNQLRKQRDISVRLDDKALHFHPIDYWKIHTIAWTKIEKVNIEGRCLWLTYRRNGLESLLDIPMERFEENDAEALLSEIQRRTESS